MAPTQTDNLAPGMVGARRPAAGLRHPPPACKQGWKPGQAGILLRELRAEFLPASLLPVYVGTALAFHQTGQWYWPLFLWCLAGVAALHAGANVFNDYCDARSGNDACNTDFVRPFTGGSRLIQAGLILPCQTLMLAVSLIATGCAIGVYLAALAGPLVLGLGLMAAAGGLAYSAPGLNLTGRGWGEALVGLLFGILPVLGAFYVQTRALSARACVLALPLALLIMAVLFINQFQDYAADRQSGKRNWVVRLGRRRAVRVYAGLMLAWMPALMAGVAAGWLPPPLLLALLPGALALFGIRRALRDYDRPASLAPANAATIATYASVALILGTLLVILRIFANP